jgi:hypothetical protein
MAIFDRPTNLNGAELIEELATAGLTVTEIIDHSDGTIEFNISDVVKAKQVVGEHNGTTTAPELTIEQKLKSVGLDLNDLKVALGL